ncbi:MAG: hypothetical protein Alis3KO_30130 [Aliiglaciecola sp.]
MQFIKILLITFGLLAASQVMAKVEYYAHLKFQETPFSPLVGIHPLNKKEALSRIHYRFIYDDQNRISEIRSFVGNTPAVYLGSFDTYYWFSAGVRIDYSDNKEVHYYLDDQGQEIHSNYIPHYAEYTLDDDGQRIALHYFKHDNTKLNNRFGAHRYHWSVDNEGRIVEKRYSVAGDLVTLRPDVEFHETRFKFDAKGQVQFMYNFGKTGKITNNTSGAAIDRIFYDLDGNFIRWQVYDKEGNAVEGNGPNVHIGEYLYNDAGDKRAVRFFDRAGYPMESSDGLHRAENTYDTMGSFIKEIQFDKTGKPIQVHDRQLNANNTRIEWDRFFDGNKTPQENPYFGGAAAINYLYNEKGLLIERRHFDKALEFFDPFKS